MSNFTIKLGDCLDTLKYLPPDSYDSMVTDPPAGIAFMGKDWDKDKGGRDEWIVWLESVMRECYRVLKPGAHCFVWALPRTSHWTGMAIENAGFEIRDSVHHVFGSGFPKSLNVSKALDKMAGAEREVIGLDKNWLARNPGKKIDGIDRKKEYSGGPYGEGEKAASITAPATDAAKQWDGWGTALKPSVERWIKARKPFTEVPFMDIVAQISIHLGTQSCLLLDAKHAEEIFQLNRHDYSVAPSDFVQWHVDVLFTIGSLEKSDVMGMFRSQEAGEIIWNIARSWSHFLAGILNEQNTSIIKTESGTITGLKTLNCYLSAIMPENITLEELNGTKINALTAANFFKERIVQKNISPSVDESVSIRLLQEAGYILANSAANLSSIFRVRSDYSAGQLVIMNQGANAEHIWLARKPLSEGTVAKNVLKHSTGALNIDASRVKSDKNDFGDLNRFSGVSQYHTLPELLRRKANGDTKTENGRDIDLAIEQAKRNKQNSIAIMEKSIKLGRFPSNFILSHHPECVERGVKKVKGTAPIKSDNRVENNNKIYGKGLGIHTPNNSYGTEAVPDFECVEGCAVKELGDKSRFFATFTSEQKQSKKSECATVNYVIKSTINAEFIALKNVLELLQQENVVKNQSSNSNALGVQSPLAITQQTKQVKTHSAQKSVMPSTGLENQNQHVNDVGKKLLHIVIGIVQKLVALEADQYRELNLGLDCTTDCKRCTQTQNLVRIVEGHQNTDITKITVSLSKLFGYALHAIEPDTQRSVDTGVIDYAPSVFVPKPSKRERNAGLDNLDDKILARSGGAQSALARGEAYDNGDSSFNKTISTKNHHPTVKPQKLMSYLIRMITPPGGTVLDPFAGSGSTGCAALKEGFKFIGIEKEKEYFEIAQARLKHAEGKDR